MAGIALQVDDPTDDPPHHSSSLGHQTPKSAQDAFDYCVRHVTQAYPNVNRRQLYYFIQKTPPSNCHMVAHLALCAIQDGYIELENLTPDGGTCKRKQMADYESLGREDRMPRGESPAKRLKVDYGSKTRPQRGGADYVQLAVNQLHKDFSYVDETFIRAVFKSLNSLYAPTHLFLLDKQNEILRRYNMKTVPRLHIPRKQEEKGKGRALEDAEFDRERRWLLEELANQEDQYVEIKGEVIPSQIGGQVSFQSDDGQMVECGCCFAEYPPDNMTSCPEKHMFCHSCISSHSSNLLLVQKPNIKCMSTEGCESSFPESALRRALPEKQFDLWERLNQRHEIAAAGLVLEDCPFCDFACVIADDQATTFVCVNIVKCGKESCRGCKKLNHLPKTCQEVRDDEAREGRHSIAEAMTFIKDDGTQPVQPGARRRGGKCLLFDAVAERHNDDVIEAAANALEQVRRELPNVDVNELQVELPPPPRERTPRRFDWQGRFRFRMQPNPNRQPIGAYQQPGRMLGQVPPPLHALGHMHGQANPAPNAVVGAPGVYGRPPVYRFRQPAHEQTLFRLIQRPHPGRIVEQAAPPVFTPNLAPLPFPLPNQVIYHPPHGHVPLPPPAQQGPPQFQQHHNIYHNHYYFQQLPRPQGVPVPHPSPPAYQMKNAPPVGLPQASNGFPHPYPVHGPQYPGYNPHAVHPRLPVMQPYPNPAPPAPPFLQRTQPLYRAAAPEQPGLLFQPLQLPPHHSIAPMPGVIAPLN
ncbi:hypothetical protein DXG01_004600 [Tephrocybe rancida]|nr:hypothetical protein DXG01_004600 [Tephrocybe rancida]